MTSFTGIIDNVRQVSLGTTLDADALAGVTVLTVVDTSDFDGRTGGTVSINGTLYPYVSVDDDNVQITLGTGLTANAVQDDSVLIWDGIAGVVASEVHATVQIMDLADAQGDAIDALVSLSLVPLLSLGQRDYGAGEAAVCEEADGFWTLTDLPGVTPQLRGELIAPGSITTTSLGFALPGGGSVFIGPTAPASPANGDMWIFTDSVNPANNTIYTWNSTTSTWDSQQVGTNSIAAGSITASLISSGAVVAGSIAAGALDAMSINAGSIQAGSLSAGNIGSSVLDSSSITDTQYFFMADDASGALLVYTISGTLTTTFATAGSGTWTVPVGVTSVKVECWGGGGGGAGSAANNFGGQGGGGGEYARENGYSVTPGAVLGYQVGAGGPGGVGGVQGTDGGDTSFNSFVIAHGGQSGGGLYQIYRAPGGVGSTNTVHYSGGDGHNAGGSFGTAGGGGGSSAGSAAAGNAGGAPVNPGTGGIGANAPTNGGKGGAGGNGGSTGANGGAATPAPGGGGGGAGGGTSARNGGAGAVGKIKLTYGGALTLVASISGVSATDPYGNTFPSGVRILPAGGGYDKAPHVVGAAGEIAYTNGYASYTLSGYSGIRYYKDAMGFVHLWGTVDCTGSTGAGSAKPICTLPAGYRPLNNQYYAVASSSATTGQDNLRVTNAGLVFRDTAGTTGTVSVSGVTFLAEL